MGLCVNMSFAMKNDMYFTTVKGEHLNNISRDANVLQNYHLVNYNPF